MIDRWDWLVIGWDQQDLDTTAPLHHHWLQMMSPQDGSVRMWDILAFLFSGRMWSCVGHLYFQSVVGPLGRSRETSPMKQWLLLQKDFLLSQGFGDGSILPEDLRQEEGEEEEPELILDGGLPRYATSSLTFDLLPVKEGREMAVDEEEMKTTEEREEEKMGSLSRKPPPSWEEWRLTSSGRGRPEEVRVSLYLMI